jgi:hypothetical protein
MLWYSYVFARAEEYCGVKQSNLNRISTYARMPEQVPCNLYLTYHYQNTGIASGL